MEGALRCVHMDTSTETDTEPVVEAVAPGLGVTSRGGARRSGLSGRASVAGLSGAGAVAVAAGEGAAW